MLGRLLMSQKRNSAVEQCATAQGSIQTTSATSSTRKTTSDTADACVSIDKHQDDVAASESCAQERSDQGWVTRFLKRDHDLLWPSEPISSASPTLLTGLTTDSTDHLIDNLMEWERKFESADLEKTQAVPTGSQVTCM